MLIKWSLQWLSSLASSSGLSSNCAFQQMVHSYVLLNNSNELFFIDIMFANGVSAVRHAVLVSGRVWLNAQSSVLMASTTQSQLQSVVARHWMWRPLKSVTQLFVQANTSSENGARCVLSYNGTSIQRTPLRLVLLSVEDNCPFDLGVIFCHTVFGVKQFFRCMEVSAV